MSDERFIVIEWADVKRKYYECVRQGKYWGSQEKAMGKNLYKIWLIDIQQSYLDQLGGPSYDRKFFINNGNEMLDFLDNGYHVPEFEHSADYVTIAERYANAWNSEGDGEADVGRMIGGWDDFYIGSAKKEKKPGLRVQIEYSFAHYIGRGVLAEYGTWISGLLGSLVHSGYDLEVDIWIPLTNLFTNEEDDFYPRKTNTLIRVKRTNELLDFSEWSALFSPGGFRHLGLTALCVAGDKIHKTVAQDCGTTVGGNWNLQYDRQDATVRIMVNSQKKSSMPRETLNKQAIKIGLLPDPETGKLVKQHGELAT